MNKGIVLILALSLLLSFSSAAAQKDYKGRYIAVKAWASTMEVSRPQLGESPKQQGRFKMVLKKEGWDKLSKEERSTIHKKLVITGHVTGKMNLQTGTMDHIFSSNRRAGILFTQEDILNIVKGDLYCSSGEPMEIIETINVIAGQGVYSNLSAGELQLSGTVNTCIGHANYLQNDFYLSNDSSYIEFNQ